MNYTIGEIVSIHKGKRHSVSENISNESSRYIQIEDLRNNLNFKYTDDDLGVDVTPKDVLIAWDGANSGTIGYNLSGKIGSTLARLRIINNSKIDSVFLGLFLQSKFEYLRRTATGATIPHINRKALEKIELPPIDILDQKRIAQVLTDCEKLIAKRKESIALLDELVKSTFLEMFGDPVRNEKGWDEITLKEIGEFKNGLNFSKGEKGYTIKSLGVGEFKKHSTLYELESLPEINIKKYPSPEYFLKNGDLVFVRSNGNKRLVGRCIAIYPNEQEVTFSGFCIRFRLTTEKITSLYLTYLFKNENFKNKMLNQGRGANITNLNQKILGNLKIYLPPVQFQDDFEKRLKRIENIKKLYKIHLTELKNLYGRLSQDAFKGDLDLSKVVLRNE